jgi:MFS family permease
MHSLPPHYRRNFAALMGDYVGFGLALTFASATTILPDFVGRLTDSKIVIGLLSTVSNGAFLLPQLVFANLLTNKPRKKPYFNLGASIGRPLYLLYAIALWLGLGHSPALAVILFFATQVVFWGCDSLVTVAWFDVLAKAMPPERRGRLLGTSQMTGGVLSIGAGATIVALLGETGPPFPYNYATLFALAGGFFLFSLFSWSFVVEPDELVEEGERPAWRDYLPHLLNTLRHDHAFRRLIIVRLLAGFDGLAIGFYVLFATRELGLPPGVIGVFTAVQTVGGILASLGMGVISERVGSHRVVQIATALSLTAPLVAFGLFLIPVRDSAVTTAIYAWVFLTIGAVANSVMLGFFNYIIELAPSGQRPTYIGLFNTIGGTLVVLPVAGGWLLQTTSYGALFALTATILAVAHGLSWGLPSARHSTTSQPAPAA